MKKSQFLFFGIFYFLSCGGISDNIVDFGNGYSLKQEGQNRTSILGPINIYSNVDSVFSDTGRIFVYQNPNYEIYRDILAGQLLVLFINPNLENKITINDDAIYRQMKSYGINGSNDTTDRKILLNIADSILANNPYYKKLFSSKGSYWVIDKLDTVLHGPLNNREFQMFLDSLNVMVALKKT